jgi:acyl-coenzyme A synthetase/AMP-(fatty) acid ligase
MHVVEAFERSAQRFSEEIFLVDNERQVSYREADEGSNAFAIELTRRGVEPGDTVGVCTSDRVEAWIAILGIWKGGALPGLVDSRTSDSSLAYFVRDVGADLYVASDEQADRLHSVGVDAVIDVGEVGSESSQTRLDIHTGESPLYLSYTSGTTGDPKGVVLQSEHVSLGTHCIADRLAISSLDVLLATTPAASSFQLVSAFLPAIQRGATVVLAAGLDVDAIVEMGMTHSATLLIAYPLTLADYVNHTNSGDRSSTLRAALSGGSPLPPRLKRDYRDRLGIPLIESYGQSEMGGFMALGSAADDDRISAGYVGRPLPDRLAYIGNEDGTELPSGEPGEVLVTERFFSHYRNKAEKTESAISGGVLHTGDIGMEDTDGYLRVLGRTGEVESARTRNGWLRDLEDAAYDHPAVKHACVVETAGGAVRCFVEMLPGSIPTAEEIAAHLKKAVPGFDPEAIILDAMPRTYSGKADRLGLSTRSHV